MSNNKIDLTPDQLMHLRDTDPAQLKFLIVEHKWLNNYYTGDWDQNERLQIIRFFWFDKKHKTDKPIDQTNDNVCGQYKLI